MTLVLVSAKWPAPPGFMEFARHSLRRRPDRNRRRGNLILTRWRRRPDGVCQEHGRRDGLLRGHETPRRQADRPRLHAESTNTITRQVRFVRAMFDPPGTSTMPRAFSRNEAARGKLTMAVARYNAAPTNHRRRSATSATSSVISCPAASAPGPRSALLLSAGNGMTLHLMSCRQPRATRAFIVTVIYQEPNP